MIENHSFIVYIFYCVILSFFLNFNPTHSFLSFITANNGIANPFATHAVANPFQNTPTAQNTTQLFGQMTLIPNGIAAANGFLNAQKAQPNAGFFNYTANGFTSNANNNATNATTMYPTTAGGPAGCGFGFGTMQQQITATGPGLTANTFNNPFAVSLILKKIFVFKKRE